MNQEQKQEFISIIVNAGLIYEYGIKDYKQYLIEQSKTCSKEFKDTLLSIVLYSEESFNKILDSIVENKC